MFRPLDPESLWDYDPFVIRKVVLDSKTSLAGAELGEGVIYLRSPRNLVQQISPIDIGTQAGREFPSLHLDIPNFTIAPQPRFLWNPGSVVDLVNPSKTPINLLHIGFKEPRAHWDVSRREFSLVISNFLNGDWDQEFKAAVQDDLQSIGHIGPGLLSGLHPSPEQVRRADDARHDLNTKVRWFLKTEGGHHRRSKDHPMRAVDYLAVVNKLGPFELLTGKVTIPKPQNGEVTVTVHTKNPSGKDSSNWRVLADPMAYKGDGTHTRAFGRLSTPTDRNLKVGDYWFWAEKGAVVSGGLKFSIEGDDTLDLVVG
jgi:hypothetical protein